MTKLRIPMAKKLLNPLEDPPTASSSSDEDEVEISSGEEDEEQQQIFSSEEHKDPSPEPLKTPSTAAAPSSVSETGSDSESEKNIAVSAAKSKKKRASEEANSEHAKRAKKLSSGGEANKKSPFQRLWTEEDEISLLQGMIDFKAEKGTSPYDDMNGFFLVAKEYISFNVIKNQFVDKIRSLKNKYYKGRDSRSFLKPHDKKCFGLANFIWGSHDGMALLDSAAVKSPVAVISNKVEVEVEGEVEVEVDKKKKKNKKKKKKQQLESEFEDEERQVLGSDGMVLESAVVVNTNGSLKPEVEKGKEVVILGGVSESLSLFDKSFVVGSLANLGMDEYDVKRKWSKVPMEIKKIIESKLKLLKAKEFEALLQRAEIVKEVASVFTQAI